MLLAEEYNLYIGVLSNNNWTIFKPTSNNIINGFIYLRYTRAINDPTEVTGHNHPLELPNNSKAKLIGKKNHSQTSNLKAIV